MAESPDRRRPKSGSSPGGYLPRLWRAKTEPEAEAGSVSESVARESKKKRRGADATPEKGRRKKKKPPKDGTSGSHKGVLLEETPVLDTVEARRTARIIAGSAATLVLLISGFAGYRFFTAKPAENESSDTGKIELIDTQKVRQRSETEAEALLERAHDVARGGNDALAVRLLTRVAHAYPETGAAAAAREALARPDQHLPLFADSPPLAAPAALPDANPAATVTETGAGKTEAAAGTENPAATAGVTAVGRAPLATNPEAALAANAAAPTTPASANSATIAPAEAAPSRTLPSGFQARWAVSLDPSGWPLEIVSSRDGAMMVLVPGGPFVMGRDGTDSVQAPAHLVKVSTYYIDKHEVTNRQFAMFLKETGARSERTQATAREGLRVSVSEDFPAVMVSAKDARDYAEWAGKRLPTEAQWEKAARGTDHRLYPWGQQAPVWVKPRAPHQIDAVMSYPNDLSPYGAYDMAGNALEWTRDWYDPSAYASYRGVPPDDPTGSSSRPPTSQVTVRGSSRHWAITAREG